MSEYGGLGGVVGLAVFVMLSLLAAAFLTWRSERRDRKHRLAERERARRIYQHRPYDWERDL